MSTKRFMWRGLAALILVGVLVVGGLALHYLAWSQGYASGQLTAEGVEAPTPPYLPHGWSHGWPGGFGLHHVGCLFGILLPILFLVVVGKLIRFVLWGSCFHPAMAGPWHGPRPGHWRRAARWHRMHGPVPPWCWGWDEDEEAEETGDESGED